MGAVLPGAGWEEGFLENVHVWTRIAPYVIDEGGVNVLFGAERHHMGVKLIDVREEVVHRVLEVTSGLFIGLIPIIFYKEVLMLIQIYITKKTLMQLI